LASALPATASAGHADKVVTIPFEGQPLYYAMAVALPDQRGPHTRALRIFLTFIETWWRNRLGATNTWSGSDH
jgi:hypothetical protein